MANVFRAVLLAGIAFTISCGAPIADEGKSSARKADVVFVLENGKSYHTRTCRLKSGSHAINLADAKKQGYKPCKVCNPG